MLESLCSHFLHSLFYCLFLEHSSLCTLRLSVNQSASSICVTRHLNLTSDSHNGNAGYVSGDSAHLDRLISLCEQDRWPWQLLVQMLTFICWTVFRLLAGAIRDDWVTYLQQPIVQAIVICMSVGASKRLGRMDNS